MAKEVKRAAPKKRKSKYDEKLSFDGTFDELMKLTVKDAEKKTGEKIKNKK